MTLNIAQQLFANTGEALIESLDSEKKFCMGLFANGIWEKRRTHLGEFTQCVHPMQIGYLTKTCNPAFRMLLPKLPVGIYNATVKFFRDVLKTIKSEVMVQIFWDLTKEEYTIYVPVQEVAGASITCKRDAGLMIDPNFVWVFDIHSHCNFGAFFSGVDTGDEKSTRLFGVIGMLGQEKPQYAWRAGFNQRFVDLKFEDIWDGEDNTDHTIPAEALVHVSEKKGVVYSGPTRPAVNKYGGGKSASGVTHWRDRNANSKSLNANAEQRRNYMERIASQFERFQSFIPQNLDFSDIEDGMVESDGQIDLFPELVSSENFKYSCSINQFQNALVDWASNILQFEQTNELVLIEELLEMFESCDSDMNEVAKDIINALTGYLNQNEWNKFVEYVSRVS